MAIQGSSLLSETRLNELLDDHNSPSAYDDPPTTSFFHSPCARLRSHSPLSPRDRPPIILQRLANSIATDLQQPNSMQLFLLTRGGKQDKNTGTWVWASNESYALS